MSLPPDGRSEADLFAALATYREHDMPWRDGRTWAYVYDAGPDVERVGKRAYLDFLSENALDPTVFPSLMRLENEVVGMACAHLNAPEGAVGSFTTGGTESCMLAMKTARDSARALRGITDPEVILPTTAHAAFHKGAEYFGIRKVLVDVDPDTWTADPVAMEAAITPNTVLMVGSAVSYAHGVLDPIEELGAIALKHGVLLHVDACIGGFLLPYFRRLGADLPPFDLSVPGVTSISMDLHKYAFCPKPSSVVLYRDAALRRFQIFSCATWTGYTVVNPTFLSTRSGGPVAASWAVLNFMGDAGYLDLASRIYDGTRTIIEGIRGIDGLELLGEPQMNLVAFASSRISVFVLADRMRARSWYLQPQLGYCGSRPNLHLSIQPQCVKWADDLIADLAEVTAELLAEATEADSPVGPDPAVLAQLDPSSLDDATLGALLSSVGVQGAQLPDTMAEINHLLDALPPEVTQEVLRSYLNSLYVPA